MVPSTIGPSTRPLLRRLLYCSSWLTLTHFIMLTIHKAVSNFVLFRCNLSQTNEDLRIHSLHPSSLSIPTAPWHSRTHVSTHKDTHCPECIQRDTHCYWCVLSFNYNQAFCYFYEHTYIGLPPVFSWLYHSLFDPHIFFYYICVLSVINTKMFSCSYVFTYKLINSV